MSVRDVRKGSIQTQIGQFAHIKPTNGESWLINNISISPVLVTGGGNIQLKYIRDSDKQVIFCQTVNVTSMAVFINNLVLHCTSGYYFGIQNNTNSVINIDYNGIVSNDGTKGTTIENGFVTLASYATENIQPPVNEEWQINAVFGNGALLLSWNNSDAQIGSLLSSGWINNLRIGVTNTDYLVIQNADTVTHYYGFIGVKTKPISV